ncbi:ATP-dependent Zn protease (plasmid) [Rhizobium sp. TH2]|uniref:ATP-dependent Zn protease n=1 Tax=Rhizobium sp. TH2 TaxID=2775403 RepID=UPI002157C2BA|nr:ATP-dependent Zn protease [Rhizobium sp. TH2]UVC12232.1 ATP-dependent Zn protease [Rhizobium sp. TH2]
MTIGQHHNGRGQARDDDLSALALLADGLTGADIERLVREVRGRCRRGREPMTWDNLAEALRGVRPAPPAQLMLPIAIHEIGHALAYELFGIGQVESVQIGGETGGRTRVTMHTERVQDEVGIMGMISCLLAGRAAEQLVIGSTMIGSGGVEESDLGRATRLAVELETACGLGEDMPLVYRPPANPGEALLYQPLLARRVDARLTRAAKEVEAELRRHLTLLSRLAGLLVERTIIGGDEVRREIENSASDR